MASRLPNAIAEDVSSRPRPQDSEPAAYPTDRPYSALGARGVQITEYKEAKVNPMPLEQADLLLEDHLSARKLRDLTGEDNLELVKTLEIKVDMQETSMGNFGAYLPNLTQLKLSNSVITSVRDLGSSLNNLMVLSMVRCGLEDIDGVASMTNLKELYLAYNEVFDVSPCSMLENLSILDLEGNNIDAISQIEFLALCQNLKYLTLEGNPVCLTPCAEETSEGYDYRKEVQKRMPQLCLLDDEPLSAEVQSPRRCVTAFDDDWRLIEELMDDGTLAGAANEQISNIARPGTAIRPPTGYRPGTALKQQRLGTSSTRLGTDRLSVRPTGSAGRPGSAIRPSSGRPGSATKPGSATRPYSRGGTVEDCDNTVENASDLTLGSIICGNPSKALKSRRRDFGIDENAAKLNKLFEQHTKNPNATPINKQPFTPTAQPTSENLTDLMAELAEFKTAHHIRQKELDLQRVPQILRIDHDDAISLSGDESVDSDSEEIISPDVLPTTSYPAPPQSPGPRTSGGFTHSRRHHQLASRHMYSHSSATPDGPQSPSVSRSSLQYDDSFEAHDDSPTSPASPELRLGGNSMGTTRSIQAAVLKEARVIGLPTKSSSIRRGPVMDKHIMRGSTISPEHRSPEAPNSAGSRSSGSRSGSGGSPTDIRPCQNMLRGHLKRVELLPSKRLGKFK